jgi:hypothetical protein
VPSRRYRLIALAMAALAIAAFFVLPLLAARVVRGALETAGADDRAAYASGASPWSWRFRSDDDVVAGKAFGGARLVAGAHGLEVVAEGDGQGEIGFPLTRQADLRRLNLLRISATAPTGTFGLSVRPTLASPLVKASLASLDGPIPLDRLAWHDSAGHDVAPPERAAMLRLAFMLPPGTTLTLHGAGLARSGGRMPGTGMPVPAGLTAEGLLHWRDRQRAVDPLVTFGARPAPVAAAAGWAWVPPAAYLLLLAGGVVAARRRRGNATRPSDLFDAGLTLLGPLWFIAGLGLGPHPDLAGGVMFAAGVAYGLFLTLSRALPSWHWRGGWRMAGWPLLAIPVALGIAAVAGHAPAWPPVSRALLYIGWAFFQQWLMLAVVASLLARALPRPAAVLLTALAFALLHTPNGLLMQLCFVAELAWAWWYLHHRALLPVAIAHATCAVIMQACMAGGILRSLEVSTRFLS